MASTDPATRGAGLRALAARHPHAAAAGVALALLAGVVLGPWAWSALRDKHTDGRWELRSGDHGVPAGLVIEIDGRQVTGQGPCNGFGADWSQDDGASNLLSTAMGCPAPVLRDEDIFFDLLSAESVEVVDDELRLVSDGRALVFTRLDQPEQARPGTGSSAKPSLAGRAPAVLTCQVC